MKNINIYNESSAITMYYGYTNIMIYLKIIKKK